MKRSPLQDVAGMVRSLHYAATQGYFKLIATGLGTPDKADQLKQAAAFWYYSVAAAFLRAYATTASKAPFFPTTRQEQNLLLNFFLLEKAIYELGYELNNRPGWVETPLSGILDLLANTS
jgi:maltose alpha-D-glucosyltransferase/alpha-amylase